MECDRQNFLSFWTIFCPFTSLTTPSIKILKKWKNAWKYQKCTKKHDQMLQCSWDIAHDGCSFYVSFWGFLHFYPPNNPKYGKNTWRYHHLHACTKNFDHDAQFLRYGARRMDGWTDGLMDEWTNKKNDIYRCPPNNSESSLIKQSVLCNFV